MQMYLVALMFAALAVKLARIAVKRG